MSGPPRIDWLARMMNRRELTVRLTPALERRLQAYADRQNRAMARHGDNDPWDLNSDEDLAEALLHAAEGHIEADEKANGLVGFIHGELMSREVYDAGRAERDAKLGPVVERLRDELRADGDGGGNEPAPPESGGEGTPS